MGVKERVSYRWWKKRCNGGNKSEGSKKRKITGGVRWTEWRMKLVIKVRWSISKRVISYSSRRWC